MPANVLHTFDNQRSLRFGANVVEQLSDGGKMAAREDVMVDETVPNISNYSSSDVGNGYSLFGLGVRFVSSFWHGNALEHRNAAILLQKAVNASKVST